MAAEIKGRIRVDSSDLDRAGHAVSGFEHKLTQAFRRSPHIRAERALEGFARSLASGDLPMAIESIAGRLTGLGLAFGLAFGTAAVFIAKAVHAVEELHKSMENLQKTTMKGVLGGVSAEDARSGGEATAKAMEDVLSKGKGFWPQLGMALGSGKLDRWNPNVPTESVAAGLAKKRGELEVSLNRGTEARVQQLENEAAAEGKIASLNQMKVSASASAVALKKSEIDLDVRMAKIIEEQLARQAQLESMKKAGLSPENVKKTEEALGANLRARIDAAKADKEATEKGIARDRAKPLLEKTQLTMQELLAVDPRAQGLLREPARLARQVQSEEALGEQARLQGNVSEAARHAFIAGQLRNQIGVLSEKEKNPELNLKNAIDSAAVFQSMLQALLQIMNGVNTISFTNR